MPHYAAFYLGLHCLPKYPFRNQGMQESLNPFTNLELLAGRLTHISLASFLWDIDKQCRTRRLIRVSTV